MLSSPFLCFKVRIERICIVTPMAIRIKMILIGKVLTIKTAEYPTVIHKREMDKIFAFSETPFPSR